MFIALLILNIVHPGLVLKGPESSFPRGWKRQSRDKSNALEQSSDVEMGQRDGA